MNFFLIDDHPQVLRILENIIDEGQLGNVVGIETNSERAVEGVLRHRPDIVIVDFLMDGVDGPNLVRQIKEKLPSCQCIMLSQVSAKNMIEKAYEAGISFYITKPINQLEVTRVIKQVIEQLTMAKKLTALKYLLSSSDETYTPSASQSKSDALSYALSRIGVLGESGAEDILRVCQYYLDNNVATHQVKVNDVCALICDQPKAMEQRLRRAINKGLVNLANLGLEDYMNDTFVKYSSSLYDFENVRLEMDFIRGRKAVGGKINVKKFIDNLLLMRDS